MIKLNSKSYAVDIPADIKKIEKVIRNNLNKVIQKIQILLKF